MRTACIYLELWYILGITKTRSFWVGLELLMHWSGSIGLKVYSMQRQISAKFIQIGRDLGMVAEKQFFVPVLERGHANAWAWPSIIIWCHIKREAVEPVLVYLCIGLHDFSYSGDRRSILGLICNDNYGDYNPRYGTWSTTVELCIWPSASSSALLKRYRAAGLLRTTSTSGSLLQSAV